MIERSIVEDGSTVRYRLDFAEADHLGRGIEYAHILAFEWWGHLMATADIERILRRTQELQLDVDIAVEIAFSARRSIAGVLALWEWGAGVGLVDGTRARMARQAREGFRQKDFVRG